MTGPEHERLLRNMDALSTGLNRIAETYGEHVVLTEEDPVTFGSGHFVFYPEASSSTRFAIEEQYTGTDWSDPDRVPTSWTWRAESCLPQGDGAYRWVTGGSGEVSSDDCVELVALAETWSDTTHKLAARAEALALDPSLAHEDVPAVRSRTYLA